MMEREATHSFETSEKKFAHCKYIKDQKFSSQLPARKHGVITQKITIWMFINT